MVGGRQNPVVRYLRRLAGRPPGGDPSDEELLRRFARHRDEDAFAIIVEKYGPMVLGVCRRVLHHPQDAEDAFQATFLVLVRKAGSLTHPGSLASWLYGVGYRTAIKARTMATQRRFHETKAMSIQAANPPAKICPDLQDWLDDEVSRLPTKYRNPLTLCYFVGLTNEEAARHLGCAPGTIFSRLARAREMLRERLVRRGLLVSTAGLAEALATETTRAAVSASLADATVKAALAFAAGNAVATATISTSVLTLTKGVQQTMFMNTLKTLLAVGLTVTVVSGTGISIWAIARDSKQTTNRADKQTLPPKENADNKKRAEEAPKRNDDVKKAELESLKKESNEKNLGRLVQERLDTARKEFKARMQQFEAGKGTLDFLIAASKRILNAETDTPPRGVSEAYLQAHFDRMKKIQDINQERFDQGRISIEDLAQAKYYRLEAEIWLERMKAGEPIQRGELTNP